MTIGIILIILAVLELLLGLQFLFRYQKGPTSLFFGLFAIGSAIYVGANGFGYVGWPFGAVFAERLSWAGGAIGTAFFLPFSFNFPIARGRIRDWMPLALWPVALFVPGFLATDVFVAPDRIIPTFGQGYRTSPGPMLWFFIAFLGVYWVWSLLNLSRAHRTSDGTHRWQLKMIIAGTLISVGATFAFDVAVPLLTTTQLGYMGSLFTTAWLGFTSYILLKA